MILEGVTRISDLWKDHEKSAKVRMALRKGMGIGTEKKHTTSARMVSGHDSLASEDVRTQWPSVGRCQETIAQRWKTSGHNGPASEDVRK